MSANIMLAFLCALLISIAVVILSLRATGKSFEVWLALDYVFVAPLLALCLFVMVVATNKKMSEFPHVETLANAYIEFWGSAIVCFLLGSAGRLNRSKPLQTQLAVTSIASAVLLYGSIQQGMGGIGALSALFTLIISVYAGIILKFRAASTPKERSS